MSKSDASAIKVLLAACESAEQTLRNLGNGALTGEWSQIAHNEAENIRSAIKKHSTELE